MSDPKSRTGEEDKKGLIKSFVSLFSAQTSYAISGLSIYSNGGTCVQVAHNQPDLHIIYGGTVTRTLHLFIIELAFTILPSL